MFKVTLLLADYVQVADAKLTAVGAGWNLTGPGPCPSGVGLLIEVPWDLANQKHDIVLQLFDGDGSAVVGPDGNPVRVAVDFEIERPPSHPAGAPLTVPVAINFGPLPLVPGSRYVWDLTIDGSGHEDWRLVFNTRPDAGPTLRAI
jgi:hypothetical protein